MSFKNCKLALWHRSFRARLPSKLHAGINKRSFHRRQIEVVNSSFRRFSALLSSSFSALLSSPQLSSVLLSSPQLFSALLGYSLLFSALLSSSYLALLSSSQLLVSLLSSCPLLNVRTTEVPLLNCLWSYPLIGMVVGQSLGYPNNSMVLRFTKQPRIGNSDGFTFWPPAMSERAICRCLQGLAEWPWRTSYTSSTG